MGLEGHDPIRRSEGDRERIDNQSRAAQALKAMDDGCVARAVLFSGPAREKPTPL